MKTVIWKRGCYSTVPCKFQAKCQSCVVSKYPYCFQSNEWQIKVKFINYSLYLQVLVFLLSTDLKSYLFKIFSPSRQCLPNLHSVTSDCWVHMYWRMYVLIQQALNMFQTSFGVFFLSTFIWQQTAKWTYWKTCTQLKCTHVHTHTHHGK